MSTSVTVDVAQIKPDIVTGDDYIPCVMYDYTVDLSSWKPSQTVKLGLRLVTDYPSLDQAIKAGERWQKTNGDNPCWNAFMLHQQAGQELNFCFIDPLTESVHSGENFREGIYIRFVVREGTTDRISRIEVVGPFLTDHDYEAYVHTRERQTGQKYCEWQCLGQIQTLDQFRIQSYKKLGAKTVNTTD